MKNLFGKYKINNFYFFIFSIIIFIAFKSSHLFLPFFWDEAWSYIPAIFKMYEQGPTLLPGQIDAWYTRGHPLLFYFLASSWTTVFGFSVISLNTFALFIALILLSTVYYIGERYFRKNTGLFASWLLMSHQAIFVQSTFVLPEILLALLLLLTLVFYIEKKWAWYVLSGSLALLTKETALTFLPAVLFMETITFLYKRYFKGDIKGDIKVTFRVWFKTMAILLLPLVPLIIFFILQKQIEGWFLYPEHTGFIVLDLGNIQYKLISVINFVFTQNRQRIVLLVTIAACVFLIYRKAYNPTFIQYNVLYILFLIFFTAFTIVNFYTLRYTLSLFPLWYLIVASIIVSLKPKWVTYLILVGFITIHIVNTITIRKPNDNTLGYVDAVKTSQQAIQFLEEKDHYHKKICTTFLMLYNLKNPEVGYLSSDRKFEHVVNTSCLGKSDIYVFTSWEGKEHDAQFKQNNHRVKKFESGSAWVTVYYSDSLFRTEYK